MAVGLRYAAKAVLGAGAVLHDENADLVARGHLGDGVAHMQPDALLPHHDRADVGLGRALDDRVDRVADQELDPLRLQDMGDRIGDFHRGLPRYGNWLRASLRQCARQRIPRTADLWPACWQDARVRTPTLER